MEVLVDARSVRGGGGLTFLVNELAAMRRVAPDLGFHVLTENANEALLHRELGPYVASFTNVPWPGVTGRTLWQQLVLPWWGGPGDVLYCPGGTSPVLPGRRKVIVTVQNPNHFSSGRRLAHNAHWSRRLRRLASTAALRRADTVVAISEHLAGEILADLPTVAPRLEVIQSGAPVWPEARERPVTLPDVPDGFVLLLANDRPHKRMDLGIRAWDAAFGDAPDRAPWLVIASRMPAARQGEQARLPRPALRPRLVHLGEITERSQVAWLLEHAGVLLATSNAEAHPLTPAEAGSLGCPLVLSDIAPHREVAGGRATYVDARTDDPAPWADALRMVLARHERITWEWPVTWDDHARRLAELLRALAPR